jgi:ferredoxin
VRSEELNPDYFYAAPRIDSGHLDPAQAVESFDETCLSYDEGEALKEAQRCFGCGALPTYRPEDCRGCTNCEQRCPASAITIEPCERPYTVRVERPSSKRIKLKAVYEGEDSPTDCLLLYQYNRWETPPPSSRGQYPEAVSD